MTSPSDSAWLEAELEAAAAHARRRGLTPDQWLRVAAESIGRTLHAQVVAGVLTPDEAGQALEALYTRVRAVLARGPGDDESRKFTARDRVARTGSS